MFWVIKKVNDVYWAASPYVTLTMEQAVTIFVHYVHGWQDVQFRDAGPQRAEEYAKKTGGTYRLDHKSRHMVRLPYTGGPTAAHVGHAMAV